MENLILLAARIAREAHASQRRKYTQRPYIEHPGRVAARVAILDGTGEFDVAAAWLHDVIEDCELNEADLRTQGIPEEVVMLVRELTNPSKLHPDLPRQERKQLDRDHLRGVSKQAKRIKLVDRLDNLRDIELADEEFRSLYADESRELADCLRDVDDELLRELYKEIERVRGLR